MDGLMSEVKKSTLRVREWRRKKKMQELSNMTSYNFLKYVEPKLDTLHGKLIIGHGYSWTDEILEISIHKTEYVDINKYKVEELENYKKIIFYLSSPIDRVACYEYIMDKIKRMKGR
jgi:hypothetical protein